MFWNRMVSTFAIMLLLVSITVAVAGAAAVDSQHDEILFEVSVVDTNELIAEGETLEITAEITNTADVRDSQQIHLKNTDSEILDSVAGPPVRLDPGETERVTLTWDLEKGDAGTHELRLASNYGSDTLSVDVQESAFFDVTINETNAPITVGEPLNVSVDVTSIEDTTETAEVWVEEDGSVVERRTLELDPGETKQIEFSWEHIRNVIGERTLAAVTKDDRDSMTMSIDEAATSSNTNQTLPPNVSERATAQFDGTDSTMVFGSDVERIAFENQTASGRVVVDNLHDVPEDVEAIDGLAGMYHIAVPDGAMEYAATIEFTLPAESVGDSETESVGVLLWNGEEWAELDTETTVTDSVTVTAETDGFSLFAVTTSQATNESVAEADDETDSESETDEENESTTQTSETNETSTDSETDTDTSATDASDTAPTAESSNEDVPGFGIGVSVLALLLTALLGGRRLRND